MTDKYLCIRTTGTLTDNYDFRLEDYFFDLSQVRTFTVSEHPRPTLGYPLSVCVYPSDTSKKTAIVGAFSVYTTNETPLRPVEAFASFNK